MKAKLVFLVCFLGILIVTLVYITLSFPETECTKKQIDVIENVQVYLTRSNQIMEISQRDYLLCVVASEIPFSYEYEAIKAQVVVARTFLYRKVNNNYEKCGDICDDSTHCQAFNKLEDIEEKWRKEGVTEQEIKFEEEKIIRAIEETKNEIIVYKGEIIDAVFHASSPHKTENARAIWSKNDVEYLQSVSVEETKDYKKRQETRQISYMTLKDKLMSTNLFDNLDIKEFNNIAIGSYTESGRVYDVIIGKYKIEAEKLRTILGLNSTDFTIENDIDNQIVCFNTLGYGHGVGMSQVGANTLATQGKSYKEIICTYYKNVNIVQLNEQKKEV